MRMPKDPGEPADLRSPRRELTDEFYDHLPAPRSLPWLAAFAAGLLIWAYWPAICEICAAWVSNADYTHGFFVVPISLWLLWARREQAPELGIVLDWRGLSLVIVAGLIRIAAGRFYLPQFDAWSIPLWIGGVTWLVFGWQTFRWALPSIAFLWFATPLPGSIEIVLSTPLQRVAASLSTFVLRVIGQPAIVEGTTILLDDHVLDVERACSGLRMFYGIFALAFGFIAIVRPARWKSILILFAAAPVAIFANVLRIVMTGILMKFASNEVAQKFSHDFAGVVMIPFAVALFLLFLIVLGRLVTRLQETGGVAWLTKWGLALVLLLACTFAWGRHQGTRAITTLREASTRYEAEKNWGKSIQYLSRYLRATPSDQDAYARLAELYRDHATDYRDQIRAIEILKTAWKQQPARNDFALSAIQIASRLQDFETAAEISRELLAQTQDSQTRASATKLLAQSIVNLLRAGEAADDYTWENAKDALENALTLPDYELDHVEELAAIYRDRLETPSVEERAKLADDLMDRIVKERANEPMAWLVRHLYRLKYGDQSKESITQAEQDLAHALELMGQTPQAAGGARVLLAAANRARARGNSERQAQFLEQAIQLSPTDFRPYLELADLKRRGNTKEARADAIEVLRSGIAKSGQRDFLLTRLLAQLLIENGQLNEADTAIVPLERAAPYIVGPNRGIEKLQVGLIRAQIINARDGARPALAHLRQLLDDSDVRLSEQRSPQSLAQAYALLGALYVNLGAPDLALDAYRRAVRIDPANSAWQYQAAALSQQTGDLDSADRDYRAMIQSGTAPADAHAALVEIELQRQSRRPAEERDWRPAARMLEAAGRAGSTPLNLRLIGAELLAAAGEPAKAEAEIVKLSNEFADNPQVWRALAALRLQQGNAAGSLEAVDRLDAITKDGIEFVPLRAAVLANSGKTQEAQSILAKALDDAQPAIRPQLAIALARLQNQVGMHGDAIATLENAHEKSPSNLQIVDMLANLAWLDQNWEKLEKYESWLKEIEGKDGTLWRSYYAQRLLASARSIQDPEFQEVVQVADAISRERPRWSKSHYLQGEIAYRMNRVEPAAAAYERAWQLGGRGPLLADRLIDLLTRQGRYEDARKYVVQVRDYLEVSPGLFDRAVPYLTKTSESQAMTRLAEQWVEENPKNSEAHLRLGRVLLLLSATLPPEERQKYIARAESELQIAIELAPNDVRPWAASVLMYGETAGTRDRALQILEAFARQDSLNKLQRDFILAQLYDYLGETSRAQFFYERATSAAQADPKAPGAAESLGRAAQFYLPRAPGLAESYARAALAQNPANNDARIALIYLLVSRSDKKSIDEALRLLDDRATKGTIDPALELRLRAASLAERGQAQDIEAAIDLLQRAISQSREDKLLLARLYERSGQIAPALELLEQLVRSPNAQAGELTEYLKFWQTHFLKSDNSEADAGARFARQANEIYQRLGSLPGKLPERVRWQIRELKARGDDPDKSDAITAKEYAVITDAFNALLPQQSNADAVKLFAQQLLVVLIQENCGDLALLMINDPPQPLTPSETAVALCHSYIAVPVPPHGEAAKHQLLENLRAKFANDADVLQAIADCWFMMGKYDNAIAAYELALQLSPRKQLARNNLALALAELPGRMAEARQNLAMALEADPQNPDLSDTLATLDIIDQKPRDAIPVLEKITASNPDSPVLRLHLAIAYHDAQNAESARSNFFAASALGVEQCLLSPRDKQTLQLLQSHYLNPKSDPSSSLTSTNDKAAEQN